MASLTLLSQPLPSTLWYSNLNLSSVSHQHPLDLEIKLSIIIGSIHFLLHKSYFNLSYLFHNNLLNADVIQYQDNKSMQMNDAFSSMSWIGFTSAVIMAFAIDNTLCRFLGR